jgi:BCD family chlorophyll transporter-like MFS transporter
MGVWGAAQAIAFALGGLIGAGGVDALRALTGSIPAAFGLVFALEAALFVAAAWLAWRPAVAGPLVMRAA